ncbi:MAG: hypothetical protein ACWGO1_02595 [Anaerolineales bacterium]
MACLLSVYWLLSACQPNSLPEAVQLPVATSDPVTSIPSLPLLESSPSPVVATATPAFEPTPALHLPTSPAAELPDPIPVEQDAPRGLRFILPDSEVVFSPTALSFDPWLYLASSGGYLGSYREYLQSTGWNSAADIVQRVALESSINPRLLLALVEYQTGCALGEPAVDFQIDYLLGKQDYHRRGLYGQLSWAASQISAGYYGWREGTLTEIRLADGIIVRPAPELNAGSVALHYYFAQLMEHEDWQRATDQGLFAVYTEMFGDPWQIHQSLEPLLPDDLVQPELILPFETDALWSYTSGPHTVWDLEGAQAALDFAPATEISGCVSTSAWVVAVADGLVLRSEFGAVVQDLSGDDNEQTGWAILYMHIQSDGRVAPGTYLKAGDPVGHPSCEGGRANGTHVHIARKYNGEWIAAGGTLPFVLSGWTVHSGTLPYEGSLTRGKRTLYANPYGIASSQLMRTDADP